MERGVRVIVPAKPDDIETITIWDPLTNGTTAFKVEVKKMKAQSNNNMFHFIYEKSSADIIKAMSTKIEALVAKTKERENRLTKLRDEYQITDAVLLDLLKQARADQREGGLAKHSYTSNVQASGGKGMEELTIGAGVVNNLLTESDFIETEKRDITRMQLIVRNLKDVEVDGKTKGHRLGEDELKYLGF